MAVVGRVGSAARRARHHRDIFVARVRFGFRLLRRSRCLGDGRWAVLQLEGLEQVVERVDLVLVAHFTPSQSQVLGGFRPERAGIFLGAIVPRMLEIRALREVERWTGPSIVATVLIVVALLAILTWFIHRYLQD